MIIRRNSKPLRLDRGYAGRGTGTQGTTGPKSGWLSWENRRELWSKKEQCWQDWLLESEKSPLGRRPEQLQHKQQTKVNLDPIYNLMEPHSRKLKEHHIYCRLLKGSNHRDRRWGRNNRSRGELRMDRSGRSLTTGGLRTLSRHLRWIPNGKGDLKRPRGF